MSDWIPTGVREQARVGRERPFASLDKGQKREIWRCLLAAQVVHVTGSYEKLRSFGAEGQRTHRYMTRLAERSKTARRYQNMSGFVPEELGDRDFADVVEIAINDLEPQYRDFVALRVDHELAIQAAPFLLRREEGLYSAIAWPGGQLGQETALRALQLGTNPLMKAASDEFSLALSLFRSGKPGDAAQKAGNAMESVAKIRIQQIDPAGGNLAWRQLVDDLASRNIVPSYLRSSLGSATAAVRNQPGAAHGPGAAPSAISLAEAELAILEAAVVMLYLAGELGRISDSQQGNI